GSAKTSAPAVRAREAVESVLPLSITRTRSKPSWRKLQTTLPTVASSFNAGTTTRHESRNERTNDRDSGSASTVEVITAIRGTSTLDIPVPVQEHLPKLKLIAQCSVARLVTIQYRPLLTTDKFNRRNEKSVDFGKGNMV